MSHQVVAPNTKRELRRARGRYGRTASATNWIDDRLGIAKVTRTFLDKIFPDHWSFMIGEIVLYSFVVLLATGIFLTLYYVPSTAQVIYHGTYRPLDGQRVTEAYGSTINISFAVRAGLLVRQMHHWAADVFIGAMVVHMGRVFLTGAFRRPRELNWYVGVTMLVLVIFEGFIGYSLPDDLISGTGLRIAYSIIESIPVVGSYMATLTFGGNFPGGSTLFSRMFVLHVFVIPILLLLLVGIHLGLLFATKHNQFRGPGRTEHNVVGSPLWPIFAAKTTGFLLMITGVLGLMGAFVQINPIWQFGSYDPSKISYAVQPDWYMGWIDGALRIMPSWEWTGWGHTIPLEVFLPAVVFPGAVFTIAFFWPSIEARITGDHDVHNLLHRPSDRPRHTAFGAGFFGLLAVLMLASSTDVLANFFHVSLNAVLWTMRVLVIVVPPLVAWVTWRMCHELQLLPEAGKRKRPSIIGRSGSGGYSGARTPPRPDDVRHELDPVAVPVLILPEEEAARADQEGVKVVAR
jgi:quinol---cytochrome-c reductase cytochrome b subunit